MPFPDKLAISQVLIQRQLRDLDGNCAVAFSGGKDSEVVLHLILEYRPGVKVVFNNTGVEYPETVHFVRELKTAWDLNLIETRPGRTFWSCVEQYGFPGGTKRGSNRAYCCYWLKEKPFNLAIRECGALGYFTGVTAVESYTRMFWARDLGTCYRLKHENVIKVNPILWWTPEEVWAYIRGHRLPYNPIYDQGADRIGCMTCTAFKSWESQLRRLRPKLYRLIKRRKDGVLYLL